MWSVNSRVLLPLRPSSSPRALVLVALMALGPATTLVVSGQAPASSDNSASPTTISTVTRAIMIDVAAFDEHGEPVRSLTAEDFRILEDGKAQTIASFDSSGVSTIADHDQATDNCQTTPNKMADTLSSSRQTILVLDEMNSSFVDIGYARFCLNRFLHQNGGRLPQRTTLMALTNDGLIELHGPSLDGPAIWQALDRHRTALPWRQLNGVGSERERLNLSAFALHQITIAGAGSNVRRSIVWVTPGFPLVSASPFSGASQQGLYDSIRQLSDEMLRARVVVYTVDPRGAPVNLISLDFTDQGSGQNKTQFSAIRTTGFEDLALERFARETGGRSFWGRNDIDAEIAHAMNEGSGYYRLSYYSSNHNFDGKFRKIGVTVNRTGVKLRTRAGYFAMADSPAPSGKQLWLLMEEALRNPMPYTGLAVRAAPAPAKNGLQHLALKLAPDRLVWHNASDGTEESNLMAEVESFTSKGKPLRSRRYVFQGKRQAKAGISDLKKENTDKQVVIDIELPLLNTAERLRIVVRDEATGNMGTADVEHPFGAADAAVIAAPHRF